MRGKIESLEEFSQ